MSDSVARKDTVMTGSGDVSAAPLGTRRNSTSLARAKSIGAALRRPVNSMAGVRMPVLQQQSPWDPLWPGTSQRLYMNTVGRTVWTLPPSQRVGQAGMVAGGDDTVMQWQRCGHQGAREQVYPSSARAAELAPARVPEEV